MQRDDTTATMFEFRECLGSEACVEPYECGLYHRCFHASDAEETSDGE